jgi:hypothetical protein
VFSCETYRELSPRNWWMNAVIMLMLRTGIRSITLTQEDQARWDAWKGSDGVTASDNPDGSVTISLTPPLHKVPTHA